MGFLCALPAIAFDDTPLFSPAAAAAAAAAEEAATPAAGKRTTDGVQGKFVLCVCRLLLLLVRTCLPFMSAGESISLPAQLPDCSSVRSHTPNAAAAAAAQQIALGTIHLHLRAPAPEMCQLLALISSSSSPRENLCLAWQRTSGTVVDWWFVPICAVHHWCPLMPIDSCVCSCAY